MNPNEAASVGEFEITVKKIFAFLVGEFGFNEPTIKSWADREIILTYEDSNRVIEFNYEVLGGCGVWMRRTLLKGPETPGPNRRSIEELMQQHEPALYELHKRTSLTRDTIEKVLNEKAQILRTYAQDFLQGGRLN